MLKLIKMLIPLTVVTVLLACNNDSEVSSIYSESAVVDFEYMIISFDAGTFDQIESMTNFSTHIIRGLVLDQRYEWLNFVFPRDIIEQELTEQGLTYEEIEYQLKGMSFEMEPELITISRVQVLEIFQGDHIVGDVIEIMKSGEEYRNQRWIIEDALEIETNIELVFFLVSREFAGAPYSLVSHKQGAYHIPELVEYEENLIEIVNVEIELEGVSEMDPISITIEDLIEIAEINGLLDDD